ERSFAQLPGIVDASVAGRVDLDDIDRARTVGGQRQAAVALAARLRGRALLAVERPGEDACAAGLATAARPREEVRVVQPAGTQRLRQRLGDMLLPDDLRKGAWPVLAVERERHVPYPLRPTGSTGPTVPPGYVNTAGRSRPAGATPADRADEGPP